VSLGTVWNDIVKGAKGVAGAVISFVEKAVNYLVIGLSHDIGLVSKDFRDAIDAITTELHHDETTISWLYHHAVHGVESGVSDVLGAAEDFARDAVTVVSHGLSDLSDWAHNAILAATHALDAVKTWVVTDIFDPLDREVRSVASDAEKGLDKAYDTLYNDVIKPIERDAETAYDDAKKAVDWIDKEGAEVFKLVDGAADWLKWMAVHVFADLTDLPADLENAFSAWVTKEAGATGAEALSQITDAIAKALG
jgi:hypothetical protein